VYFEKICRADRSWKFIFWSWKSDGKSLFQKSGHPAVWQYVVEVLIESQKSTFAVLDA